MVLAAFPLTAQTITDGDTLKLNGTTYRLWGIDAPETKQDWPDGWPAGRMATTRLLAHIQGKTVVCEKKDTDRYGRTVAICRAIRRGSGRHHGARGHGLGVRTVQSRLRQRGGGSTSSQARRACSLLGLRGNARWHGRTTCRSRRLGVCSPGTHPVRQRA